LEKTVAKYGKNIMARSLKIEQWKGRASFQYYSNVERLKQYLQQYYEGRVLTKNEVEDDMIHFTVCEHLSCNPRSPYNEMDSINDLPLIIFHPEGDIKYFHYDKLKEYGNCLSCNYMWKDISYFNYWAYDYRNAINYYNIKLNTPNSFTDKFLCLNGRPDWHRFFTLQKLKNEDLFDKGLISLLNRYGNYKNIQHHNVFYQAFEGRGSTDFVDDLIKNKTEIVLDRTTEQVSKDDRSNDEYIYANTSISLVTETYPEAYRGLFITEKSWKPIAHCHFPIWISQPFMVQAFRDWGFDMFDDIIDNSYDKITNDWHRFDAAINSLKKFLGRIKNLDPNIYIPRLISNREKYMAMKITESDVLSWFK
jgi:hypothetical protein